MVVITVSGGKGGTGKTLVAASIALEASSSSRVLLVDLDADNPCVATLLGVKTQVVRDIVAPSPMFVEDKCVLCGACAEVCPAGALAVIPGRLLFIQTLCEGCMACAYVCRQGAIRRGVRALGWMRKGSMGNLDLLVAEARAGERRTGDVAEEVLKEALSIAGSYDILVIDTPAGTSRVIKRALDVADIVVLVTEPTKLGIHDLRRILGMVKLERTVVVVNKYGMPGGVHEELSQVLRELGIQSLAVPYDARVAKAYSGKLREFLESGEKVGLSLKRVYYVLEKKASLFLKE